MMEEPPIVEMPSRWERCRKFLSGSYFKLYCSYFLSSWGDRMWAFSLSIALGKIGGNLRYTAVSGLLNSAVVLFFAASVGRWIDRTPRLKAATTTLIINNVSVALSASILVVLLFFLAKIDSIWSGGLSYLMTAASIALCALSVLANNGTKICVTKDWVVVICGSDREKLADVNAMMVRIDMTSLVLSPLIAGQIMTSASTAWGCAFIGFWNVLSFFAEYFQLLAVYNSCPALAVKRREAPSRRANDETLETETLTPTPQSDAIVDQPAGAASEQNTCCLRFFHLLKTILRTTYESYGIYFRQAILPAGLSLASLYLTVLSFDGVTTVYVMSMGLPENLIALCRGIGAIMGFTGSMIYPRMRRRVGVQRTGLMSLTLECACLLLPVASIWLPGTNFDPYAVFSGRNKSATALELTDILPNASSVQLDSNSSTSIAPTVAADNNLPVSFCSLSAFLTGVVLSRLGLWMADLSISQVFQESVAESERGVVNGVQSSLNHFMNIAKSILVIILPDPHTFGILIIISWLAVFTGYLCFCYYSYKVRGHILPFHNQLKACTSSCASDDSLPSVERNAEHAEHVEAF